MAPALRLGEYIKFLRTMQPSLKNDECSKDVTIVINKIRNVLEKAYGFMMIDLIQKSEIDLSQAGSFLIKDTLNLLKPKKDEFTVFLFEKRIVFAKVYL